ncbi:NUDIX hydrolase [Deinococcus sp. YIM 77859]|uniref:NUDIX hydrolase n=1 Tax=Deinococcus sp. YIM 77859 TaxID=1540221 RepID=UPI000553277A|nr:NUDIX hydrolase [Deinococcus sp. YIM 77859]
MPEDVKLTPGNAGGQRRRRRRRGGRGAGQGGTGQASPAASATKGVNVPVPAPPSKRGHKRPLAEPRIGVGCVVLRGEEILLVRERGRWSLPKGGLEAGELVQEGARRETYEETGLVVELRDLAFIVEFQAQTWGHHLQFFYTGREVGGMLGPRDPDRDVQEARFVPIRQLREFIRFRPRLVALETWLRERRPRHFVFNLDKEPAMLRKRRRVGVGAVEPDLTDVPTDEADL